MLRTVIPAVTFLCFGLSALVLSGCGVSDDGLTPARGPDDLAIVKVESLGSAVTESDGLLTVDCSGTVLVWFEPFDPMSGTDSLNGTVGSFNLSPPGSDCGEKTNCGWIKAQSSFTPPTNGDKLSAEPLTPVDSMQSPVAIHLDAQHRVGSLTVGINLVDAQNNDVLKPDGSVLTAEFSVTLKNADSCP